MGNYNVIMAVSKNIPIAGERYVCSPMQFDGGIPRLHGNVRTSEVREVKFLGDKTYAVATQNNVYITKIC